MFDDVSRSTYQLRFREEAVARAGCQVERGGGDGLASSLPLCFLQ